VRGIEQHLEKRKQIQPSKYNINEHAAWKDDPGNTLMHSIDDP
jgi:hypothetical protein